MPELPEVEVLRRSLEPRLTGERIDAVDVRAAGLREPFVPARLAALEGRRIEELGRRAKYLLIHAEGGRTLVIHLGMSGSLVVTDAAASAETHEHLVFRLASGRKLRFRDPRRFGLAFVLPRSDIEADRHFAHLGIEPLSGDFSGAVLERLAQGRRGPVKGLLMDATAVVGLGNIYATEALFRAGIHPRRSVARIASRRWESLGAAVVAVLGDAIREGGTTLNDFSDGEGNRGYFQVSLSVYGREGEPCPRCEAPVRRIVQAGRSTFYCPRCQR